MRKGHNAQSCGHRKMGRNLWRSKLMKKLLDAIWEPFDKEDSTEWILLGFGMFWVAVILGMGIMDFIYYVR